MIGVDSVLSSKMTKARKKIIDSGVAGRNMATTHVVVDNGNVQTNVM